MLRIVFTETGLRTGQPMTFAKGFKKTDLRRAILATKEEGLDVQYADIKADGTIRLVFTGKEVDEDESNGWDEAIKKRLS